MKNRKELTKKTMIIGANIGNGFNTIGLINKEENVPRKIRRYTIEGEDSTSTGRIIEKMMKKGDFQETLKE